MKKYVTLGEVSKLNMGQSPDSSTYNDNGEGIPFYQGNADFGDIHPKTAHWCTAPTKIADDGDILISVRAPIGALNIATEQCCIGRGLAAITVDSKIVSKDYIWYMLKSKVTMLQAMGTGSTFKAINKNVLNDMRFLLPTFEEQDEIALNLSKIDTIIRICTVLMNRLDILVKSRFVEMFGDCRTNPKGWNTIELGNIAYVGSSKRVFVEELVDSGIPFYRGTEVGALAEGKMITPELFISQEHYEELIEATGKPIKGDLLMPSICPDGRIWVVDTDKQFYFKDGRVLWVHNINKQFDSIFLLYTLKDRIITDYQSIASGTTFAELKIFALKQCKVFEVPIEIQRNFSSFVKQTDKSKLAVKQVLEKAEMLKKALMQKYFG